MERGWQLPLCAVWWLFCVAAWLPGVAVAWLCSACFGADVGVWVVQAEVLLSPRHSYSPGAAA